jgi:long-subunit fatty acid transport protein
MRLTKHIFINISIVILVSQSVFCGSNSTFDFLRNDVSARAAAMGGSFLIVHNDPNAIFYNPSALTTIQQPQASVGFFKNLLDINSGHLSYSQFIEGFGFVGGGIVYTNYGDFIERNEFGDNLGNFSANELALSAAYANKLTDEISYGGSLKFIYSSIAGYSSSAFAVDLGTWYVVVPERFEVAASIVNLGTQIDPYINTKESLPTDLKIGCALKPEHLPLRLNFSFNKLIEKQNNFISHFRAFSLGGEFSVAANVQLRFGYNNEQRKDFKVGSSSGLAGFSIGGGFIYDMYKIDYAFNSMGKIGGLHRVTVGILL